MAWSSPTAGSSCAERSPPDVAAVLHTENAANSTSGGPRARSPRRIPRPPGPDVDAVHGDERPQLLRPLVLERAGPHRRGVPRDRPRRVPEPRGDRRVRDDRDAGSPGRGANVRRARRRPHGAGGRPLSHRGARALAEAAPHLRREGPGDHVSTSRGTGRSLRTRSLATRPEPAAGSCSTRRGSRRWAPGKGG